MDTPAPANDYPAHQPHVEVMHEAVVSTPAKTGTGSKTSGLPHAFTRENAADNARKAVLVRETKRKSKLALASLNGDSYVQTRLSRVRAQLQKIDALIDDETDPQKLDRLVCAQNRLSEQWRIFSGIPLPGSRRPGRETNKSAPSTFEPSE